MRAGRPPPPAVGKARAVVHDREKKLRACGGTRKTDRSGSGACGIVCSATLILDVSCGDHEPGRAVDVCGSEHRDVGGVQGCGWWNTTKKRPGLVSRRSSTSQRGNEAWRRRCGPIAVCAVVGDGATSGVGEGCRRRLMSMLTCAMDSKAAPSAALAVVTERPSVVSTAMFE